VPGHPHGRLRGDGDNPSQRDQDLERRDDEGRGLEGTDRHTGEGASDEERQREVNAGSPPFVVRAAEGVLDATQRENKDHDAEDGQLDVVGLPEGRGEESTTAAQRARVLLLTDSHQHHDPHQGGPRDELGGPLVEEETSDQRQREVRVEQLPVCRDQCEEQQPEGDHDEPVRGTDDRQP
jgi:hypothetical protein